MRLLLFIRADWLLFFRAGTNSWSRVVVISNTAPAHCRLLSQVSCDHQIAAGGSDSHDLAIAL
jgi:hypothetical protein